MRDLVAKFNVILDWYLTFTTLILVISVESSTGRSVWVSVLPEYSGPPLDMCHLYWSDQILLFRFDKTVLCL